jgi:hypothetical protein
MNVSLPLLIIAVVVNTTLITPFLWLAGRAFVGSKAKFAHAFWIVFLGTIIGAFVGTFFSGLAGLLIQLILWLALVSHFFDCGWLKALAISIVAVVIFAVIAVVLGVIGLSFLL